MHALGVFAVPLTKTPIRREDWEDDEHSRLNDDFPNKSMRFTRSGLLTRNVYDGQGCLNLTIHATVRLENRFRCPVEAGREDKTILCMSFFGIRPPKES